MIFIRAKRDGYGRNGAACRLCTAIGELNEIGNKEGNGGETMPLDEAGINEVTSSTTINEEDSGLTGNTATQLDEWTRRGGELINLRRG